MSTKPSAGYINISAVAQPYSVLALLGHDINPVPQRAQRVEVTDRDRRVGLTTWTGSDPLVVDIEVLLDTWSTHRTIEAASTIIDRMAGTHPDSTRPMRVTWDTGAVIPYDYTECPDIEWTITAAPRGEGTIRSLTGNRRRELITLTFQENVVDESLEKQAQRNWEKRAKADARASLKKKYLVKKGDTYIRIAKTRLKNSRRWKEIARLNGDRSSDQAKNHVGKYINLP